MHAGMGRYSKVGVRELETCRLGRLLRPAHRVLGNDRRHSCGDCPVNME